MKLKKSIPYIIFSIISPFLLKGLGVPINIFNFVSIALILSLAYNIKWLYPLFGILIILISLYYPTGDLFGRPNSGYFASLYYTNLRESVEYIKQLNYYQTSISLLIILLTLITFFYRKKNRTKKHNILKIFLLIILIHYSFIPSYSYNIKKSFDIFIKEKDSLNNKEYPNWIIKKSDNKTNINYILIIGESVRKDYLSLYGYYHNTTPFLNNENGIFIDGLISPGPNTATSLTRMLTKSENNNIKIANNIISLANMANISTYWISNQGTFGKYDSPISSIAVNSNFSYFINEKSFTTITNDDFNLLPLLNKIIESNKKKKLIVIHMMGSHPKTCERLHGFKNSFNEKINNKDISCYLATIHKLDTFIKEIVLKMKAEKQPYSILYISDHGMDISNESPYIKVNNNYKQNYEVPLFILDNQMKDRIYIKRKISGFNFIDFFSNWIGISTNQLNNYKLTEFPEDQDIEIWNWNRIIKYEKLKEQAPINK
ncbi:TPA: phosphoethanolamine transferase [Proteus mirabilis]|nr:phosphoethanolamine transferase [Proteus mirabilis]